MIAIYKRELKSYFTSMIGPFFIAMILFFMGLYFMIYNLNYGYPYFSYTLNNILLIYIVSVPILTMRSMADERRTRTDQMLLTAPVSVPEIVMGKYFAMATVLAIPMLISCICPILIKSWGSGYPVSDYATIMMFFLLGCAYIAIGMFISSLTESQIISTVISFAVMFALYLMNGIAGAYPTTAIASCYGFVAVLVAACLVYFYMTRNIIVPAIIAAIGSAVIFAINFLKPEVLEGAFPRILDAICPNAYLASFARYSMFNVKGVVFFLSIAFFFCFLTCQSIQKRRWS